LDGLTEFLVNNIEEVFFFYGLSFFAMGLAIYLEMGHSPHLDFARALRPLALFGLVHGCHEWFEMFLLYHPEIGMNPANTWISTLRVILLGVSFLFLVDFGAGIIAGAENRRLKLMMQLIVIVLWILGLVWVLGTQPEGNERMVAADVYTRYALAIPGAVLTVWGLLIQRRRFFDAGMHGFGNDVALAALAFGMYGGIGQLFASPSVIFPSKYLNADVFVRWFGIPVQVFRALMACMAAVFIIRSMRAFEVENQRQIENLREAQLAERRRLEEIRGELLQRTVKAQESERQRIARELHDETGQTFTALAMGLRGLSTKIRSDPNRALDQAQYLEKMATNGISDLQRLVSGLHPPQLDDLGLRAALRWYANEIKNIYGLPISVNGSGSGPSLTSDERIVFFRIAQEAVTNIVRHALATQAKITFNNTETYVSLSVEDNGQGFEADEYLAKESKQVNWGLVGMVERAALLGATCTINSQPGQGTHVEVYMPREASV
jgi:signal transduction histidine kinase